VCNRAGNGTPSLGVFSRPGGGVVFNAGTADAAVQQVTRNVVTRLAEDRTDT
jgi:hypothetical protein